MEGIIPDLWPAQALKADVLKPTTVLRAQAAQIATRTQGILVGSTNIVRSDKGEILVNLDVSAPALKNYRFTLLSVRYNKDAIYPATVLGQGMKTTEKRLNKSYTGLKYGSEESYEDVTVNTLEKTAYSESEFLALLREVFSAKENIALLQSLIVSSNDQGSNSDTEEAADVTGDDL